MRPEGDPGITTVPRGLRLLARFIDWYPPMLAIGGVASVAGLIAFVMAAERAAGLAVYDPALGGDPMWMMVQGLARAHWPLLAPSALYSVVNAIIDLRTGRPLGVHITDWNSPVPPTPLACRRALWFAISLALSLPLSGLACLLVNDAWGSGMYEATSALWAGVSVGTALLQGLLALVYRALRRGVPLATLPAFAALLPPGILALTLSDPSRAWPEALCLLAEAATLVLLIRGRAGIPNGNARTMGNSA